MAARDGITDNDMELLTYRVGQVESVVKEINSKVDKLDNIKRDDLKELSDTIIGRFNEIRTDLQKQIDKKADRQELQDLKKLIWAAGGFLGTVLSAIVIAYLAARS